MKDILPQNMKESLKDAGENSVLVTIFIKLSKSYDIYKNYSDSGCDIILIHKKSNKKIKIEVKTRQIIFTSIVNHSGVVDFNLTKNEYDNCDYLIGYWFDKNEYFIVPQKDILSVGSSNNKWRYKISNKHRSKYYYKKSEHRDNWDCIH